jgi:hypothetical protein
MVILTGYGVAVYGEVSYPPLRLKGSVNENEIPVIALGVVTPSCSHVNVTVAAVAITGTATLEPQVTAVQVPQFFGLPAESVLGGVVLGVETAIVSPTVPVPVETGPILPATVNDIPVYADASMAHAPA